VSVLQVAEHRTTKRIRLYGVQSDLVLSELRAAVRGIQSDLAHHVILRRAAPKGSHARMRMRSFASLRMTNGSILDSRARVNNDVELLWSAALSRGYFLRKNFWIDTFAMQPHLAPAFNDTVLTLFAKLKRDAAEAMCVGGSTPTCRSWSRWSRL
jgi:hypothetical protein